MTVDWSTGAYTGWDYKQGAANSRVAGKAISGWCLNQIKTLSLKKKGEVGGEFLLKLCFI